MKIVVASLVVLVLFSVNGVAQEYTRWGLPEGAKMHLGKGQIFLMKCAPDGSRFAVASSIDAWHYDSAMFQEIAFLSGDVVPIANTAFGAGSTVLTSGPLLPILLSSLIPKRKSARGAS